MFQEHYQKNEYSCFDFPAHPLFTFDVFWGSLSTSVFGNSILAANNAWSRLQFVMTMLSERFSIYKPEPTNKLTSFLVILLQITKMLKFLLLKFFQIHTVQQSNKNFNENPARCLAALIDLLFLKSCLFERFKIVLFEITLELCCTPRNKLLR